MYVLNGYDHVPQQARGAALAIGNFDGVHRGHQALLAEVRVIARELPGPAGVMMFEPHPRAFFQPDRPHFELTPLRLKLGLLERYGMDLAVVLTFDAAFAGLSAEDFVERVLVAGLGVRHVVIGYDFHYGKGRAGSPATMQDAGRRFGFGVTVVAQVAEAGEVFSSSQVRAELAQGDVRGAADMLGHWWRVAGEVVGGARRGTGLGFPTVNIVLPRGVTLGHGIYAARVYVHGKRHHGAAYLGTRPTFDSGPPVLEVFLFDFDGDLYGREIEVEFIAFLRGDRAFTNPDDLKVQMAADCDAARAILAAADRDDPMARFAPAR
ncbi:MAG: bifunctional riboflavin kinase/FAD synthetase [Variibacter sp.]